MPLGSLPGPNSTARAQSMSSAPSATSSSATSSTAPSLTCVGPTPFCPPPSSVPRKLDVKWCLIHKQWMLKPLPHPKLPHKRRWLGDATGPSWTPRAVSRAISPTASPWTPNGERLGQAAASSSLTTTSTSSPHRDSIRTRGHTRSLQALPQPLERGGLAGASETAETLASYRSCQAQFRNFRSAHRLREVTRTALTLWTPDQLMTLYAGWSLEVMLFVQWLLQQGNPQAVQAAVASFIAFDTYNRPGEVLRLRPFCLARVEKKGNIPTMAVIFHPSMLLKPAKNQHFDDTVLIGSSASMQTWLAPLASCLSRGGLPTVLFFNITTSMWIGRGQLDISCDMEEPRWTQLLEILSTRDAAVAEQKMKIYFSALRHFSFDSETHPPAAIDQW